MTHNPWKLYEKYVDCWKMTSEEERAKVLDAILTSDMHYLTPEFEGGPEAVLEDMRSFQKKFPGGYFGVEDISSHHDVALFTWVLLLADGKALVKGHDHLCITPEGKIASITTYAPSTPRA